MNTRTQAALIREMYSLIPEKCQLWIATHSIGMMREAFKIHKESPNEVVFFKFLQTKISMR